MNDTLFKRYMQPGATTHNAVQPEMLLVRGGAKAYLWVGDQRGCFATLSGAAVLRRLARAILAEVGEEP